MATAVNTSADWTACANLQSYLVGVKVGLGLTIEAYDLIIERLREGDRIDYVFNNAPDSKIVIEIADQDPHSGSLRHEIQEKLELVRDQYLTMVIDNATAANTAIHNAPAAVVAGLDSLARVNWIGRVRLILNRLTMIHQDETSFPSTVGQFIGICKRELPIDHWREAHVELKERLKELGACAPPRDLIPTDDVPATETAAVVESNSRPARALEALIGEEDVEILNIAHSDARADDRMRAIFRIDRTVLAWNSQRWGDLLDVTRQAIEKTPFWKIDRPAAIEAARD